MKKNPIKTLQIEVIKNTVYLDNKKWGVKPNDMDLGTYILNMLFYVNRNGKEKYKLIIDGIVKTSKFKSEVKKRYIDIPNKELRDSFFMYANIKK